ncbi:MAG: hypothetical protein ACYDHH_28910 [Solirubrobacteraceae bacterium]
MSAATEEFESPDALLRRIYDEDFGFLPTNSSMKPVHVANGMARRLVGFSTDHTPLARVLRQYVKKQKEGYMEERNPNSVILADYPDRFRDAYGNEPSHRVSIARQGHPGRGRRRVRDEPGVLHALAPPNDHRRHL